MLLSDCTPDTVVSFIKTRDMLNSSGKLCVLPYCSLDKYYCWLVPHHFRNDTPRQRRADNYWGQPQPTAVCSAVGHKIPYHVSETSWKNIIELSCGVNDRFTRCNVRLWLIRFWRGVLEDIDDMLGIDKRNSTAVKYRIDIIVKHMTSARDSRLDWKIKWYTILWKVAISCIFVAPCET